MKKQKKQNGKVKSGEIIVSPTALSYAGPSKLPARMGREVHDEVVVQLQFIGSVASSAAGLINTVFDNFSQASSSPDWSSYTSLYGEYRILSMDVILYPWNKYNQPTTNTLTPVWVVEDRGDSSALTTLNSVMGYESAEGHPPSTTIRKVVKMSGSGESNWIASGSSPAAGDRFYVKLYSSGNTASVITYYDYIDRVMVQFRNRK